MKFIRKAILLLFLNILLPFVQSCAKDYPDDIPKWLKEMIHDFKLHDRTYQQIYCYNIVIREYSYNDRLIYTLSDQCKFYIYDQDGKRISNINSSETIFIREIWTE